MADGSITAPAPAPAPALARAGRSPDLAGWSALGRLIGGVPLPAWWPTGQAWNHGFSTLLAAILALYVAFAMQLESPGSALTTVVIVSGPLHGMVLSKGLYRFLGTVFGVVMSVVMIALFAQAPMAFMVALAVWMGICVYVSSLLRYFRAYAAVLAGYTLSLVAVPAVEAPLHIFDLATARVAVVTVGVVCCALVKGILSPRVGRSRLRPALGQGLADTMALAAHAVDQTFHIGHPDPAPAPAPFRSTAPGAGMTPAPLAATRRLLAQRLLALDAVIEAAASESAETAQEAPAVRLLVSVLQGILTLAVTAPSALECASGMPVSPPSALVAQADAVRDLLRAVTGIDALLDPAMGTRLADLRRLGDATVSQLAVCPADQSPSPDAEEATLDALALSSRLDGVVRELMHARELLNAIERGRSGVAVTPVTYHRDRRQAAINGLRAALATLSVGVFWIVTGWPHGAVMMAGTLPACALLGTADQPDRAALGFAQGVALSAVAAFLCQFYMMAPVSGFPLLALSMAPFILVGAALSVTPSTSGVFVGFLIFFTFFTAPRNPMRYDMAGFLNTAEALVSGIGVVTVFFRVLWPVNAYEVARRLVRDLCGDVATLALAPRRWRRPRLDAVLSRMQDRLARLSTRLVNTPRRAPYVEGGLALMRIAHEVDNLRHALDPLDLPDGPRRAMEAALAAVGRLPAKPGRAVATVQRARATLLAAARQQGATPRAVPYWRAAAACHEIARMLGHHLAFFTGRDADPAFPTPTPVSEVP